MNTRFKTAVFVALVAVPGALGLGGCASPDYRYVPADHRSTTLREAIYSIPAGNPSGTVRVQFVGIEEQKQQGDRPEISVVHLRLLASNHSKAGNWQISPLGAFVSYSNGTSAGPLSRTPENLVIQPGQLSGMDLYFQLPPGLQGPKDIPAFDFHWNVMAVDQNVAQATPFDRIEISTQYAAYDPYWDGPNYPGFTGGMGFGWNNQW
jgi:hypothetical protein